MAMLKPELKTLLERYGIDAKDKSQIWDCHGTLVLYHKAYEIIAAKEKITFDPPTIIEGSSERKTVAILVVGRMGERSEWSIGEAAPGNCKNAYPYAMAEKRAKDRVVAKLAGLAAYVYSEDEAEDFKTDERKPVETTGHAAEKPKPVAQPTGHSLKPDFVAQFWARESYTVTPPKDGTGTDWQKWRDWLWQIATAAPNLDCILKLRDDNRAMLDGYKIYDPPEHKRLVDHLGLVEAAFSDKTRAA